MKRRLGWFSALELPLLAGAVLALAVAGGCSGKAIVDGTGGGGPGPGGMSTSDGATTSVTATVTTSTGSNCIVPPPDGLGNGPCFGSGSGGPGEAQCVFGCSDQANNTYSIECTNGTCNCLFNDQIACSCTSKVCVPTCCPAPWNTF